MVDLSLYKQLASFAKNTADAVILIRTDRTIMQANNAYINMLGWTVHEVNDNGWFMFPNVVSKELEDCWNRVCSGHGTVHCESVTTRKDGSQVHVSITLSPIDDEDGLVTGVGAIIRDITQIKTEEQNLKYTKALLESLYQNTLDAICVVNLAGRTVRVNQAFANLYGFSEEELIGKELPIIRACDLEFQKQVHQIVHGGQKLSFNTICLHRTGKAIEVEVTMAPVYDMQGNITGSSGIARDITARKIAEEKLRQSEEKYRLIADNTLDLILVIGSTGIIQYASPSHLINLHVDPHIVEGKQLWNVSFLHPSDKENIKQLFTEIVATKMPNRCTTRLHNQNGEWLLFEVQAAPVVEQDNQVNCIVLVARDITELEKTQEIIRKSEKLSVAGELAAGIAHEIRNPLTSIKGFIQIMQSGFRRDEYLDIIISEINRMETIISEFLLLARPQTINVQQTNLDKLLTTTLQLVNTHAIYRDVQLAYSPCSDILLLHCDQNQMKQVFINVLKNGIESIADGGTISVVTSMFDQQTVKVSFHDTGCGIPQDRLLRLGEPFYSTKEKGTGLGLMISHKIIKEHHGKITVESEVGKGTTVNILLPISTGTLV